MVTIAPPLRQHFPIPRGRTAAEFLLPKMLFFVVMMLFLSSFPKCRVEAWSSFNVPVGTPLLLISTQSRPPQQSLSLSPRSRISTHTTIRSSASAGSWRKTSNRICSNRSKSQLRMITNANNISARLPIIDEWKVLTNGRVVGTVKNHPSIPDGDIITTSPIDNPELAARRKVVSTISGSRYMLGVPGVRKDKQNKTVSIQELQRQSRVAFDLTKDVVGDDKRQYLLAGKPSKSTSGKSLIYKAFRADGDGLPQGDPWTVKISSNWEAIEREADNYAKITKAGLWRGQFVSLIDFLPTASVVTKKFQNQSALVMERGVTDLKRYIAMNGALQGKELRDACVAAAQCIQAVHGTGLVWTDMKSENFVVTAQGEFKGIDLESAMPVKDNPVDYSPEGTPPEFARAFLAGDGPYFVLQYNYDIWSLGMLFYEISVGKNFFAGKTPFQITKMLRDGPDINLQSVPDPSLRNLIGKCLQLDPRKRPGILEVLLHPYFLTSGIGPFSF